MSFLVRKIKLSKWTKYLKFEITEKTIEYLRSNVVGIADDTIEKLEQLVGTEYSDETIFFQEIVKKIGRKKLEQCNKQLRASAAKQSPLPNNQVEILKDDLDRDEGSVSFWICNGSPEMIDLAVLALMTAEDKQYIETLDIVLVPIEKINNIGLEIDVVEGNTVVDALKSKHRDVILENESDRDRLVKILISCVCDQKTCVYTHKKIKDIMCSARDNGMLDVTLLTERMRTELL